MTSHRDAFLNAVDTDRGLWQSIDVRVIAVHAQGAWHNLITQCYLRSMEPGQVPRLTQEVRSPTLWAGQYILPVEELPSLLSAVESGEWATGDNTIIYRRGEFDSGPPRPYDLANSHFHNLDLRHVHPDFEWAGQVLHASGDHWSTIVQRTPESWQGLESTVRHQPYPFQCLDDLASYITGIQVEALTRQATFEVFAPYEVRLVEDGSELEDGTVHFALEAGSAAAAAACTLRVLPEPRGMQVPASTVLPGQAGWSQRPDGVLTYSGEHTVGPASAAALVLGCGREAVRWLTIRPYMAGSIPVPLAVYRLIDPGLKILKSWLSGKESKDPQGKFELAVARLFTLAGFQANPFTGHKRLSEGVDFLAHARRQHTCVVAECTTGGIDGAKLTKFVKRLSEIRRALGDVRVIGLLATSTPLEDLSKGEIDRALADGLIIVPAGGLAALFEIVAAGTSVPAVLDFLSRQHIPPGQPTRTLKTKGLDLALTRRRGR